MLDIIQEGYFILNPNKIKIENKNFIYFSLVLSYGCLDKNNPIRNKINQTIDFEHIIDNLNEKLIYKNVRIWYNSHDNEELCNMYFLVDYLSKYDLNIYLNDINLDMNGFIEENLLNNVVYLNEKDKNKIIKQWKNLVKENAEMRIIRNNKLVSCTFNELDILIIEELKKLNKIEYNKFIMHLYLKKLLNINNTYFLQANLNRLINNKKIKVDLNIIENKKYLYL